ncbi:helix-turn-helix domain-containing protein, partial [Dietzia cercidiphylli]|uniref:helix-turn-helix domain-containing protein n=2 Tax=Dietzia cercidiphylli TaxID=498199 RepID=UPI0015FA82D3
MNTELSGDFIPHMTTGDRLRRIRRDLKLTQHEFAVELGVKESTYNAWETGRNAVADEVAIAKRVQLRWKVPAWWTLGLESNGPHQGGPSGGNNGDYGLKVRSST